MTAPYVRHATDGVAVPLDGLAGSLLAVFDNVLLGLGWTKPFSGVNKAVYRPPAGHRRFLRVDDTGTTTARLRMYDSMSDIDTGTNPVPLDTQVAGGVYISKSNSASSAARDWAMFVADSYFYLWINQASAGSSAVGIFFGDFDSLVPGDLYNSALIAQLGPSASYGLLGLRQDFQTTAYPVGGEYAAGTAAGAIGSVVIRRIDDSLTSSGYFGASGMPFPNPADGKIYTSPVRVHESGGVMRGTLPGAISLLHSHVAAGYTEYTIFDGSGDLAGRRFMAMPYYSSGGLCHEIPPGYLM